MCLCCRKYFGMWRGDVHDSHFSETVMPFNFLNLCIGFWGMDHTALSFTMLTEVYALVHSMFRVEKMGRGFGIRVPRFIQ